MTRRRIEQAVVRWRIDCDDDERAICVEIVLDGLTAVLSEEQARVLAQGLGTCLGQVERFGAEEAARAAMAGH
jgi:hypothetical protein